MTTRLNYLPFGDENAESDELLIPCQVDKKNPEEHKAILVGRWGIGKSALLLLQNQNQSNLLRNIDPDLERIWYVSESSLDVTVLANLKHKYEEEPEMFIKSLEEIWKSEVARIYVIILSKTRHLFKKNEGEHWDAIQNITSDKNLIKAVWSQVPEILDGLIGDGTRSPIKSIKNSINSLVSEKTFTNITKCLKDIDEHCEYLPCIVIEPIETPTSALEKHKGLAQYIIIALLNTFHKNFKPDARKFHIRISIPWHRYTVTETDFPQKLFEHKGFVEWTKESLREFIEKRIRFEYDRVNRKYPIDGKGLWYTLFDEKILNGWCDPQVYEDSFDYFVRHTHYRPRDLLRLARECLMEEARIQKANIDEVLHGKINVKTIKDTFHKIGSQITIQLIEEGNRRFAGLSKITECLYGLPLPFSTDDLKKRFVPKQIDFNEGLTMLWESGILGVMAIPTTNQCSENLGVFFTTRAKMRYLNKNNQINEIWTWFEHNYDGQIKELLSKLEAQDCTEHGLTFHPKTLEYFYPKPKGLLCPIGN